MNTLNKQTFIAVLAFGTFCFGQNGQNPPELTVVDPEISNDLKVPVSRCKYVEQARYYLNENSVVYEDCNTRKYIPVKGAGLIEPKYSANGFFMLDKSGVYYRGDYVKVDTTGFKMIGLAGDPQNREFVWKVKSKAYRNLKPMNISDPDSFRMISCNDGVYYKDKNGVFFKGKAVKDADPATISEVCEGFLYDKNHVYQNGQKAKINNEFLIPVNDVFVKTKTKVYNFNLKEQPGIDAKTIRPLLKGYSIDANHVYFYGEKTPVEKENFKNVKVWQQVNSAYISDGKSVWSNTSNLLADLDGATFGMIPHSDFFYDKNGFYKNKYVEKLRKAVNEKFRFNYTDEVTDHNFFITDDSRYIIYNNQAFDPWENLLFENLTDDQIMLAKQNKLRLSEAIKNVKIDHMFDFPLYLSDGKIYFDGKETQTDAATFKKVGLYSTYYKDANNVYSYNRYAKENPLTKIKGMDPETLSVFGSFLKDKNYIYSGYYKLIGSQDAELLGVFTGRRPGCSLDTAPSSDYYLFKNAEGFWLIMLSDKVVVRHLGMSLSEGWHENKEFELNAVAFK